jgi:hypothetical protein
MRRTFSLFALVSSLLAAAACGADGETGEEFDYGLDSGVRPDARADGGRADGATLPDGAPAGDAGARGDAAPIADGGAPDDGSASIDGSVADGGARPDAGQPADAGGTVDAGAPDAGIPDPCAAGAGCAAGANVGTVRGDTGSDYLVRSGTASTWLLVRVSEAVSSLVSYPDIRVRVTLTHAPNTLFDLFLYRAGSSDANTRNCSSVTTAGTRGTTTNVSSASLVWSDSLASDDDRNVMIEIRHRSGPCGAGREWQLQIEGNAQ